MKNFAAVLLILAAISSNLWAYSWAIECKGTKQTHLTFSETSLSGEPLLSFQQSDSVMSLSGKQIHIARGEHDGQMSITATKAMPEGGSQISFEVPALNWSTGLQQKFDTEVNLTVLYMGQRKPVDSIRMNCTADGVLF